jgi:hypothetical protein
MGSSADLQELGTINAPAYLCHNTKQDKVREEFLSQMNELLLRRIIQLDNAEYVLANVVKKTGSDQVIIHIVNYLNTVKNLQIRLNLEGVVDSVMKDKIKFYSPDHAENKLNSIAVNGKNIEFIISDLEIYDMIVIN